MRTLLATGSLLVVVIRAILKQRDEEACRVMPVHLIPHVSHILACFC